MVYLVLGRGAIMNLTVCDQTKRSDFVDRKFNCSDLIWGGGRSFSVFTTGHKLVYPLGTDARRAV